MLSEIKIAMLGAQGTGKTSLLTSMYEQFATTIGKTDLQFTPDLTTSAILAEKLGELKSLLGTPDVEPGSGIPGDETHREPFIFDLGNKGSKPSIRLRFQDFPGNYLNANAPQEKLKFVQELIDESAIILIAIDAPSLMEANGRWHDKINRPQQIRNFFEKAFQDMKAPRLVIFVPIKCEKYMKDPQSAKKLLNRVKEGYSLLFDLLAHDDIRRWVATVVTPIQTIGTVSLSYIEEINNYPHFHFKRISPDAEYAPEDTDQPLRYLLRFALKLQKNKHQFHWGPFNFVRNWLGWDEHLKEASQIAAEGCKTTNGFAVIRGDYWLNIK
jgi:hypothetical protein